MKRSSSILVIFLLLMAECESRQSIGNFIMVDITKSYPKKELILQDFMDVEYISLETNDEFLCQGLVQDIGKEFVVVRNRIDDGDIFIFDRNGKALGKINRKGQGGEEYTMISTITLDEERGEIFVNEHLARKILVYDLDGNFKRTFKHKETAMYNKVYNFDRENLICWDGTVNEQSFSIISKRDGSITGDIKIPIKKKVITSVILKDESNNRSYSSRAPQEPIIPYHNNYILTESSSDTVYEYLPYHNMNPFIARTPSIQSMSPEVFLFPSIITDRYCFMEIVKKEYDFGTQQGFPGISLMYDRKEKAIFKYTVYNNDYSNKRQVSMDTRPVSGEIATWQNLNADHLVEYYRNGKLKGRLKEIAATLAEEDNPVIMLIKHKK
jgi:hypothetical protein